MSLVLGVRWSFRGKDAGSVRIRSDTGATEDAVLGASSAARGHSVIAPSPPTRYVGVAQRFDSASTEELGGFAPGN
jgi:hypothetical protein